MDQDLLPQAERHVIEDERQVAHMRGHVAKLEREGQDTAVAVHLLGQFEELQAFHVADRDRLRKELGLQGSAPKRAVARHQNAG